MIFIIKNWKWILLAVIVLGISSYIGYLNISIKMKEGKIDNLIKKNEELASTNLLIYKELTQRSNETIIITNHNESIKYIDSISTNYVLDESVINGYNMNKLEYWNLYGGE